MTINKATSTSNRHSKKRTEKRCMQITASMIINGHDHKSCTTSIQFADGGERGTTGKGLACTRTAWMKTSTKINPGCDCRQARESPYLSGKRTNCTIIPGEGRNRQMFGKCPAKVRGEMARPPLCGKNKVLVHTQRRVGSLHRPLFASGPGHFEPRLSERWRIAQK
eukprot:scaffold131119_cov34-Tisochrysis_lutea.AAC.1